MRASPSASRAARAGRARARCQRVWRAGARPDAGQVFGVVGAKGGVGATTVAVNVATVLARDAPRRGAADRHPPGAGRRGGVPRGRAALLGASTPSRTPTVSTRPTSVAWSCRRRGGRRPAGLVRHVVGDLATDRVRQRWWTSPPALPYVVLDLPALRLDVLDGLDSVTRIVVVVNQELATVRNATRLVERLRAALRQRAAQLARQPLRQGRGNRPRGRREGGRPAGQLHHPERLPGGAARPNRAAAGRSTPQPARGAPSETLPRDLAGLARRPRPNRPAAACSAA